LRSDDDDLRFSFVFPYVQMTTNDWESQSEQRFIYMVSYTNEQPGPSLYEIDSDSLTVQTLWTNPATSFNYFDLQYSPNHECLYGIKVVSTYGRSLSRFILNRSDRSIAVTELFALPLYWYVNASSFDINTDRYFALINNFAGFDNSTLDQQIVLLDAHDPTDVTAAILPILSPQSCRYLLYFLSYSAQTDTVFVLGRSLCASTTIVLTTVDYRTGILDEDKVIFLPGLAVGPLLAVDADESVYFFLQVDDLTWNLHRVDYNRTSLHTINTYSGPDHTVFAAAALHSLI
jgi:hypothetical protein